MSSVWLMKNRFVQFVGDSKLLALRMLVQKNVGKIRAHLHASLLDTRSKCLDMLTLDD